MPSVDQVARDLSDIGLPHPLLVDAARAAIAASDPESARARAEAIRDALLRPVINATGVLLHTNLGRAPVAHEQIGRAQNVEFDLESGVRGSRHHGIGRLLAQLCGAEDAIVVNNCAAALVLALNTLADGRAAVISRGELVEIGGGFRIPDVLAQSGARLVEVGTTNRTRLSDYRAAAASLILKVHQSNYRIVGFTESVAVRELATLGPPVIVDLGSGLLDENTPWLGGTPPRWLQGEPGVRQTLAAGAALVTFSGDKLLGGPQAGVITGRADLVDACARHPLARALRPGGLVLGALQATALAYLRNDGDSIPFWRMATTPIAELRARAEAIGEGDVVECASVAGAGSLPGLEVPSVGVALKGDRTAALRANDPPVIARVRDGRTILDLRTVDPADDPELRKACQ